MVELKHYSTMALNIKNREVERLVDEVAAATGESKTEAVRKALLERRTRLRMRIGEGVRQRRVRRFLEDEVWAVIPDDQIGCAPDKAEREAILGYGPEGA